MKKVFKIVLIILIFSITLMIGFNLQNRPQMNEQDNLESIKVFLNTTPSDTQSIEVLRKEIDNEDVKAILKVESLGLNSIVVQTTDNSYYMNHDATKKYDIVGSIFMDYRNTFDSKKIIIYGHNSQSASIQTEFGNLSKYTDLEFTKANPYMELITDKSVSKWEIFSVMVVPNNTTKHTRIEFTSEEQLKEHIDWMISNSMIDLGVTVTTNDQFMTLQTCFYNPADSFLLINLKKVGDNSE